MNEIWEFGQSVIVRPGERYEELNLDISGWRGRVVGAEDEYGDLLVAWDSQTLREIPETAVAQMLEYWEDWTCMYVEPEALLPYESRDTIEECLSVARERTLRYNQLYDDIADNPLFADFIDIDDDDWDDDDWDDDRLESLQMPTYFDLDQFLYGLEIPPQEHPLVRQAFIEGLTVYNQHPYGYRLRGAKNIAELIPHQMAHPFVFGYGVLTLIDKKGVSQETRVKVCQYALSTSIPSLDDGIPHGTVTIMGYLAKTNNLPLPLFAIMALATEYSEMKFPRPSIWQSGTRQQAVLDLLDWLAREPQMSPEEKLFWVWRFSLKWEFDLSLARAAANFWLNHPDVSAQNKQALCWAWLTEAQAVGAPPLVFQLVEALIRGNREKVEELLLQLPVQLDRRPMTSLLAAMPQAEGGRFYFYPGLVPPPLKRIAVLGLVQFGEDPQTVIEMFWDEKGDVYIEVVHRGIADVLRAYQDKLDTAVLRDFVQRGIAHSRATVRKSYHALALELYGDEFLPLALVDNTATVRDWAKKQQQKRK